MHRRSLWKLAGAILLAAAACAAAKDALLNVTLQWKPTSELKLGTFTDLDARARIESFLDVRDNRELIGENLENKEPKPVTTAGDVGQFVGSHVRDLLERAGVRIVDKDADVTIKGEVRQFLVKETDHYNSQVTIRLTVVNHRGNKLWSGIASGEAHSFGRSYKLENYHESLSNAIVNMVSSMLHNEGFQKALSTR
jgi:hypothetical protein